MGRTARCPSCGAPVEFRSVASILAVCDFCKSTLVRDGNELKNLGRMAELIEDRSPLQRGAEGKWKGAHFALVGRIQYRYDAGLWNEWHLLFDNGRSGWLSEAGGEYVISLPRRVPEELPEFAALHVGDEPSLDGATYRVTNILTAQVVAGEGELPFTVGAGYAAPVADLRNEAGGFATLDYSDERPLVFIGESVDFASLGWANLRENLPIAAINAKARAINCPACGAPIAVTHENIASVGCASCGALLDTANDAVALIARATAQLRDVPWLALGAKGKLGTEEVELIGYMARRTQGDGPVYRWNEYVLLAPEGKLVWLTEYDGHWNVGHVVQRAVRPVGTSIRLDGDEFKHFATYGSSVDYVIGEFPWQVRIDETAMVEDYVAPPRMLSHEVTEREETWTLLDYLEPQEVQKAFALDKALPQPRGVYANQVNPHAAGHAQVCARFWKFAAVATAVHLVLVFSGSSRMLLEQPLTFTGTDDEPLVTREFRLDRAVPRLDIEHQTDIRNNWADLSVTLVNKTTGQAWHGQREISQYEGVEDGEKWSEGSRSDELTFIDLPAGTYELVEEPELGTLGPAQAAPPVHAQVKVARAGPRWSSYFLLLLGLALFPIYTRMRRYGFESKRWAESDHPHVYGSSEDADGDSGGDD
jgi:hypothetical protein